MAGSRDKRQEPGRSPMHRARRGRNIAVALLLVALIVLFYVITIVRMGGG